MNNLSSTIDTVPVKKLKFADTVATADSVIAAINDLDNRLSDVTIDQTDVSLSALSSVVKQVVVAFGGTI